MHLAVSVVILRTMSIKPVLYLLYKKIVSSPLPFNIGQYAFIGSLHNFFIMFLKPDVIEFEGFQIALDKNNSLRLSKTPKDISLETAIIRETLKAGQVAVDVGAHIGYYSLIFAKLVGKSGRVFAFEPDLLNFVLLKKNIHLNGYSNVKSIHSAVADSSGKIKLYKSNSSQADHRTYDSKQRRQKTIVSAVALDDYFKHQTIKIDFVKIDVQGSEMKVLTGMLGVIKRNRHIQILTEFWPEGLSLAGDDAREYLGLFEELGFKILEINERESKLKELTARSLLEAYTVENRKDTNLLCIR